MKAWIVNLIAKLSGAGKLLESLNGIKTYLGGGALILSGAAQLLNEIVSLHDAAGVLEFVKHIMTDPAIASIAAGLVAVGLRHAIAKQEAPQP